MEQIFRILPPLPDDHAAYQAFHKAESEKRLVLKHKLQQQQQQQEAEAAKAKPKKLLSTTNVKKVESHASANGTGNNDALPAIATTQESDDVIDQNNDSAAENTGPSQPLI